MQTVTIKGVGQCLDLGEIEGNDYAVMNRGFMAIYPNSVYQKVGASWRWLCLTSELLPNPDLYIDGNYYVDPTRPMKPSAYAKIHDAIERFHTENGPVPVFRYEW